MRRLGDSYLSMPLYFPRKMGGGTLPLPPPRYNVVVIRSSLVSNQSILLGGEGGSRNRLL